MARGLDCPLAPLGLSLSIIITTLPSTVERNHTYVDDATVVRTPNERAHEASGTPRLGIRIIIGFNVYKFSAATNLYADPCKAEA